jgi:uncharacterized iron-regulated membrane protein
MTGLLVVVALVGGVVLLVRRRRRKAGVLTRTISIEPPTGRLGKRKREML